jgi:RNA polymerase sigma-70 factor (ECF subfamily)
MAHESDDLVPTRASLIARLKNWQDQSSWQEFFDNYWKLIYGVARQSGLRDAEAQDVVQETMASVAKHMPGFQYNPAVGSFKGWLLQMTRWRIIDQVRKRAPDFLHHLSSDGTGTGTVEQMIDPSQKGLDELWEKEWRKQLLEIALSNVKRKLDPEKYQIFDYYVNKEWPAEKVAERFQISVDQVYLAKCRITDLLQAEVARLEKRNPL